MVASMLEQIKQRLSDYEPKIITTKLPKAAVLLPITQGPNPELIFTRRAAHLSTHGGEIAFPGGKYDGVDTSLEMTALRESYEEINLPPDQVEVIGQTNTVISRFGIEVTPYIGIIPANIELKPNLSELDTIFRAPIAFFLKQSNLQTDQWVVRNQPIQMPSYRYETHLIWGLTAIMLVEFLNITLDAGIPLDVPQIQPSFATTR